MSMSETNNHAMEQSGGGVDQRSYARVTGFFPALYRVLSSPEEPQLCPRSRSASDSGLGAQLSAAGNIPVALVNFLVALNAKVDSILALMQKENLSEYFPHQLMVTEISASGILVQTDSIRVGDYIEIVMYLGEYPPRVVSAVGHVLRQIRTEPGKPSQFALHFVKIRESDREDIVRYVFQEERLRIRSQKLK